MRIKTVAICIDKNNGVSFYGKRQSSDREVRKRLLAMDGKLFMTPYSAAQFTLDETFADQDRIEAVVEPAAIVEGTALLSGELL